MTASPTPSPAAFETVCPECGRLVPAHATVTRSSGEAPVRTICLRCFNGDVAAGIGLTFEHVDFPDMALSDAEGRPHRFHFALRLLGDRLALDAFEPSEDVSHGYRAQVIGAASDDPFELQARLVARLRRRLSQRHLDVGDDGGLSLRDLTARGHFAWDDASGGAVPRVVIDGREVTWPEFGRMLAGFEGWQFRLDLVDPSEES